MVKSFCAVCNEIKRAKCAALDAKDNVRMGDDLYVESLTVVKTVSKPSWVRHPISDQSGIGKCYIDAKP